MCGPLFAHSAALQRSLVTVVAVPLGPGLQADLRPFIPGGDQHMGDPSGLVWEKPSPAEIRRISQQPDLVRTLCLS